MRSRVKEYEVSVTVMQSGLSASDVHWQRSLNKNQYFLQRTDNCYKQAIFLHIQEVRHSPSVPWRAKILPFWSGKKGSLAQSRKVGWKIRKFVAWLRRISFQKAGWQRRNSLYRLVEYNCLIINCPTDNLASELVRKKSFFATNHNRGKFNFLIMIKPSLVSLLCYRFFNIH